MRLPLYSQAKKPFFQTSAKPSRPSNFSAPFSNAYQEPVGSASVGGRLAEHPAQIAEVGLGRGPLAGRHAAPLRGELGGGHASVRSRVPMPSRIAAARSPRSGLHDADIVLATWTGRAHPRAEQRLGRVRADLAADQMAIVILATLFGLSVVLRDGGAGVDHDALLAAVRLLLTGIEPSPARA